MCERSYFEFILSNVIRLRSQLERDTHMDKHGSILTAGDLSRQLGNIR